MQPSQLFGRMKNGNYFKNKTRIEAREASGSFKQPWDNWNALVKGPGLGGMEMKI